MLLLPFSQQYHNCPIMDSIAKMGCENPVGPWVCIFPASAKNGGLFGLHFSEVKRQSVYSGMCQSLKIWGGMLPLWHMPDTSWFVSLLWSTRWKFTRSVLLMLCLWSRSNIMVLTMRKERLARSIRSVFLFSRVLSIPRALQMW